MTSFIFLIGVFSIRNFNLHNFEVSGDTPAVGLWEEPLKYNVMEQLGHLKSLVADLNVLISTVTQDAFKRWIFLRSALTEYIVMHRPVQFKSSI